MFVSPLSDRHPSTAESPSSRNLTSDHRQKPGQHLFSLGLQRHNISSVPLTSRVLQPAVRGMICQETWLYDSGEKVSLSLISIFPFTFLSLSLSVLENGTVHCCQPKECGKDTVGHHRPGPDPRWAARGDEIKLGKQFPMITLINVSLLISPNR